MLILSRKTGQETVIAGNIHVTILGVRGDRVKLGIQGPANVPIHREEVYARISRESSQKNKDRTRRADEWIRV